MIYFPQIKTTAAELTAIENIAALADDSRIIPIIQLTKPKITKSLDSLQALEKHLERTFKRLGKDKTMILGITKDETYQDANLSQYLNDPADGYVHWVDRLIKIRSLYNKNIIPQIVGKASASTLPELRKQITSLVNNFERIAISLPAEVTENFEQLEKLLQVLGLTEFLERLNIIIDFGYRRDWAEMAQPLQNLNKVVNGWGAIVVPIFSSCPSSFPVGEDRSSTKFRNIHMAEHEGIPFISTMKNLSYGDYAYIHPERKDVGGFWLPRIDYPAANGDCYYIRSFNRKATREEGKLTIETLIANEDAYKQISKLVTEQPFFSTDTVASWGRKIISENFESESEIGKSPQHYIAVRSNVHMERVLSRLAEI